MFVCLLNVSANNTRVNHWQTAKLGSSFTSWRIDSLIRQLSSIVMNISIKFWVTYSNMQSL